MTTNVDYAMLYLKYPVPTPIIREPTQNTLKWVKHELQANASSVDTDLGGGYHGYLGVYLSDVEYARINPKPTPFIASAWPGVLQIDAAAIAIDALHAKERHHKSMRLYRKYKYLERALLRHTQNALEFKYIEPLLNNDTGLIEDYLPTVLQYLDQSYGKVQSEEVKQKEAEVLSLSFNPADSMVALYRPIDQLQKLATAARIPYSEAQKLEIGLTLIRSTQDFEKALGEWTSRSVTTKTWETFKAHFKDTQAELQEIHGSTMKQVGYHHANILRGHLCADLQLQGTEMLELVQSMVNIDSNPPVDEAQPPPQPPPLPVTNTVMQDNMQVEILRLLRDIAQQNGNNCRCGQDGQEGQGGRGMGNKSQSSHPRQCKFCLSSHNAVLPHPRRMQSCVC